LIPLLLLLAGCAGSKGPGDDPPALRPPTLWGQEPMGSDPRPAIPMLIQMTMYRLSVPLGTVSGNAEFWKRVDEQSVDPVAYRRLRMNGVRVGLARHDDWDYFKDILLKNPVVSQETASATTAQGFIEMSMKSGIDSQVIFFYDAHGDPVGRSYDQCDNTMVMSFQSTPRKPGLVRVELCPVVRALRTQIEVTTLGDQREVKFVRPEHYYDLNLRVDVPMDEFLIVAPSPEGRWPSSIGQRFLIQERPAALEETVLLLAPRPFRLDQPATQAATNPAANPNPQPQAPPQPTNLNPQTPPRPRPPLARPQ
jgi:hypothetical protein